MFAGKKSAQIREILISESAWEEMTCLFAPSLMKRTNGEMDNGSIIYRYTYLKDEQLIDEEGHCSPIKDGGFIEGSKSY